MDSKLKKYTLYGKSRTEKEHLELIKALETLGTAIFPSFIISGFDPGVHFRLLETHVNFVLPIRALLEAAESAKLEIPEVLHEFCGRMR